MHQLQAPGIVCGQHTLQVTVDFQTDGALSESMRLMDATKLKMCYRLASGEIDQIHEAIANECGDSSVIFEFENITLHKVRPISQYFVSRVFV